MGVEAISGAKLATVEAEAVAASDALATAKKSADDALAEMHAQQKAYDDKCAELAAVVESDAGTVTKGRASAELAQLKAKDPLPLDRAKINQGATVRKVGKAAKKAKATADAAQAELPRGAAQWMCRFWDRGGRWGGVGEGLLCR